MDEHTSEDRDEGAWNDIRLMLDAAGRQRVRAVVDEAADALTGQFYRHMLADPAAAALLDHDTVNRRLHASMVRWLRTLFDPRVPVRELMAVQRHVGEVHARIGVSMRMVGAGCRQLKRALAERVLHQGPDGARALQYVYELVDVAMEAMGESMLANHGRLSRSDESYRLFFLSRNLRAERERQRSHLLEWLQQMLLTHYWEAPAAAQEAVPELPSPFEQWVSHKAELLFQNEPELAALRDGVDLVRLGLLPRLRQARQQGTDPRELVAELHRTGDRMKATLAALFDRAAALEQGRDDVTQLLSRRYLPAILRREIGLAQAGGRPFALLLLELDGFEQMRHALGPEVSDVLLAQAADCVVEHVRASDFAFRYGDGRLLLLVVDADGVEALRVAHGLRAQLEALVPRVGTGAVPRLAASVGVASYDGHPDYQRLIERAEHALRDAQQGPRVALAPRGD